MCKLLRFPIDDVTAPEGVHRGETETVGFQVDSVEMEVPLELCEALGMTKTMFSRVAWRIGTSMMHARAVEADRD